MEIRTFHGSITPTDLAHAIAAEFDQGNLRSQILGDDKKKVVQIASPGMPASGGHTAVTVELTRVEDGVLVRVGQQEWLGVAASIGKTALMAAAELSLVNVMPALLRGGADANARTPNGWTAVMYAARIGSSA